MYINDRIKTIDVIKFFPNRHTFIRLVIMLTLINMLEWQAEFCIFALIIKNKYKLIDDQLPAG